MNSTKKSSPVGLRLDHPAVETPAFVVDEQKLTRNLARGFERAKTLGVRLRPHLKTHKSIAIARRQMMTPEGPATVSTLEEARYFAARGVSDLIYAVGISPQKLPEVARIRRSGCDLKIILDSPEAANFVSDFCMSEGCVIPVLLEIDVDGHRSGIDPESDELIHTAYGLRHGAILAGVLTHAGGSYDHAGREAAAAAAENERAGIVRAAERLREAGYQIGIVSAGSTPTFMAAKSMDGVTEIRAGVYAFCDLFQANIGACSIDDIAGSVLTTVIGHRAAKNQIIVDAGWMAMSRDRGTATQATDYGYGLVCDINGTPLLEGGLIMTGANQEHGIISARSNVDLDLSAFPIGTRLRILPNHACPTAAPHRVILLADEAGVVREEIEHVRGWG